jgi:hypothetical protein
MMVGITKKKRNKCILFLALAWIPFGLHAGSKKMSPQEERAYFSGKYPGKMVVCVKKSQDAVISYNKKGELVVNTKHYQELLILDDKIGQELAEVKFPSSSFFKAYDMLAYSLVPKGSSYSKKMAPKPLETKELGGSVFHDDQIIYATHYPIITNGTKLVEQYSDELSEPHFFGGFYFDMWGIPVEEARFSVQVPEGIKLIFSRFNIDESKLEFAEKKNSDGSISYTFTMRSLPDFRREDWAPSYRHIAPHLIMRIAEITKDGKTEPYLGNVNDLHNWYVHFVEQVNQSNHPELDSLAKTLTAHAKSDEEKVRNVYYWVQSNIKYIAFEDGLGGFVPRNAGDIYSKRFGDCKDMSSIMHQMLTVAGVKVYLTWIGTRDIPYTYEQVPSPFSDNHMILSWHNGKEWVFVDGTSTFNTYGMPSSFIQGKEALIHLGKDKFEVVKVPEIKALNNSVTDSCVFSVKDGVLIGKGKTSYIGYYRQAINNRLEGKLQKEIEEYFSLALQKGNNKFVLENFKLQNFGDRDKILEANYEFNVRDYVTVRGEEVFVNLHLNRRILDEALKLDRKYAMERKFATADIWHYVFVIPAGYECSVLPDDSAYRGEKFSFSVSYRRDGNRIVMELSYINDFVSLAPSYFPEWNKMIGQINTAFKHSIILKKIK